MYRQIIIPNEQNNQIDIPREWYGQEVEVILFPLQAAPQTKLSDKFKGVFSKEAGESFMAHTQTMRNEWNNT